MFTKHLLALSCLTLCSADASALPQTLQIPISLQGGFGVRHVQTFVVQRPGWISATYRPRFGPSLALILNGPGRVAYFDRADGNGVLHVRYCVRPADLAAGSRWTVSVASFNHGFHRAAGHLSINFPSAGPLPIPLPTPPAPAERRDRTFEVEGQRLDPGEFVTRTMGLQEAGTVRFAWFPKAGSGMVRIRVRQKDRVFYIAQRAGAGNFEFSMNVTPAMLASCDTFKIEIVNLNGDRRKIAGKLVANKPVP